MVNNVSVIYNFLINLINPVDEPSFILDPHRVWKNLAKNEKNGLMEHVQYILLKSLEETNFDINKASKLVIHYFSTNFVPIRRKSKLSGGRYPYDSVVKALGDCRFRGTRYILGEPGKYILNDSGLAFYEELIHKLWNLTWGIGRKTRYDASYCRGNGLTRTLQEYNKRKYVYIFVRQDLKSEYQLVQAAHAAYVGGFNLAISHQTQEDFTPPSETYFTVIGVPDLEALNEARGLVERKGYNAFTFTEPDIGNEVTAFITSPIPTKDRGKLLEYNLLRFNNDNP
jgi:hypothetical protein